MIVIVSDVEDGIRVLCHYGWEPPEMIRLGVELPMRFSSRLRARTWLKTRPGGWFLTQPGGACRLLNERTVVK